MACLSFFHAQSSFGYRSMQVSLFSSLTQQNLCSSLSNTRNSEGTRLAVIQAVHHLVKLTMESFRGLLSKDLEKLAYEKCVVVLDRLFRRNEICESYR